jgi:ketosteroid isomerase-like protein
MTESDDLTAWMDRYRAAWTSNAAEDIRGLFTEDAEYLYNPWDPPVRGADPIVSSWLESQDAPADWTFEWHPVARDGRTAVIEGRTVYLDGRSYRNLWVIVLEDDGRASRFTEWYMKEPSEPSEPVSAG